MEERLPRKLAVILHADVAGYSRLAGANEDATHIRLSASRELVSELTDSHRGQVVNTAGDAVLAMFDAVADALTCAISIQRELGKQNSGESDDNKLQFRIGINLGDVIEDKGDIFGDGVNVAARLEGHAEPGGICISGPVYDAVSTSLKTQFAEQEGVAFKALGIQELKNIPELSLIQSPSPRDLSTSRMPSSA